MSVQGRLRDRCFAFARKLFKLLARDSAVLRQLVETVLQDLATKLTGFNTLVLDTHGGAGRRGLCGRSTLEALAQ